MFTNVTVIVRLIWLWEMYYFILVFYYLSKKEFVLTDLTERTDRRRCKNGGRV